MRKQALKLLGAAMALVAVSAITASTALAANTGHVWEVNGVKLANGATQTVGCELEAGNVATLKGTVTGSELHLTAKKVECINGLITQDITGTAPNQNGVATDSGKLKFSEITVDQPVGCGVEQPITTTALQTELVTKAHGTGLFDTFKPAAGTTFTNITIIGCAAAETYPVKGSVCGETNEIGIVKVSQILKFNATADTACAPDGLFVGGNAAIIRAEATNFLTGANAGKTWGAKAF